VPAPWYSSIGVKITFDAEKNQRNIAERQISFRLAEEFEWETALIWEYAET
jgi:uncharacterized DUF497 family protein